MIVRSTAASNSSHGNGPAANRYHGRAGGVDPIRRKVMRRSVRPRVEKSLISAPLSCGDSGSFKP